MCSSSALRMFLKLQRLLSQQAVLIKTMFHLFLMIINCPCNEKEKKKNFSARKIIPPCGQTDSSQMGVYAHFSGIWNILPLAGHSFLHSHHPVISSQRSHRLQISKGLLPSCHCPKTNNPAGSGVFPTSENAGIFRKGDPSFIPECLQLVIPPN
ncbi:hypothetical protein H1C71_018407 [Ictidomys tridecemlineatus]|nr:hypothetical protein H1C71_018407 [Ictidomys tridecemlineatus]